MEEEEKEALHSVYSRPGEVDIIGNRMTVNLVLHPENTSAEKNDGNVPVAVPVCLIFSLKEDYPDSLPDISIVSEHLTRNQTTTIKTKVIETATDLLGLPMILALVSFIEECVQEELKNSVKVKDDADDIVSAVRSAPSDRTTIWNSVLHIDHMRSKNKYCKTLEKWSSELGLCGRILFCNRLILVLLQGELDSIKDFIVRLKTTSIDVDSKGHSCKERMMTPLCEQELHITDSQRFTDFKKQELSSEKDLKEIFETAGLSEIYQSISASVRGYL